MSKYNIVLETSNSTVVSEYEPEKKRSDAYQSEAALEKEFIRMLTEQGYDYLTINDSTALVNNLRTQLELLNDYKFSENEWTRFFNNNIANNNEGIVEKTGYALVNNNVQEYKSVVFQTYRIRGNQILINDKNGKEWTWYFTDDEDTLEYAYQDGLGGETYTVSQKIRHHDSLPDYDTAMSERKNKN